MITYVFGVISGVLIYHVCMAFWFENLKNELRGFFENVERELTDEQNAAIADAVKRVTGGAL